MPPQTHDIFVSNPSAVALAGHLDVLCFDKTGTLTEPGLDLQVGGWGAGCVVRAGCEDRRWHAVAWHSSPE